MFDWYSEHRLQVRGAGCRGSACHHRPRPRGTARIIDHAIARALTAGTDYLLNIVLKANVVTVTLGGQVLARSSTTRRSRMAAGSLRPRHRRRRLDRRLRMRTDDARTSAPGRRRRPSHRGCGGDRGSRGHDQDRDHDGHPLLGRRRADRRTVRSSRAAPPRRPGSDYTGAPRGTIYFAPGQTTATITFTIVGDAVVEPDETFVVRLQPNPAANLKRPEESSGS